MPSPFLVPVEKMELEQIEQKSWKYHFYTTIL